MGRVWSTLSIGLVQRTTRNPGPSFLQKSNSTGDLVVVDWGVTLQLNKTLDSLHSNDPSVIYTALSVSLLDYGWYGDTLTWVISLLFIKSWSFDL